MSETVAFIYIYIYIYIYLNSSFPKRVKDQSKNRCCNADAKFGDHVLENSSS